MFRGITNISIDAKGRVAIPVRYRESLISNNPYHLVVTIDTESPCLLLYPTHEWNVIEAKLQELPSLNRAARRIQRLLIGHATELEIDNNGRILLPPLLRDYAKLDKSLILLGQGKKFELWDEQQWAHHREQWLSVENNNDESLPQELSDLVL